MLLLMGEQVFLSTGELWWMSHADTHTQCGDSGDQRVEKTFYV